MFDVSREMGSSVALYSRKVLIQTKATDILPKWLRFLRGGRPSPRPLQASSASSCSLHAHLYGTKQCAELLTHCVNAGVVDSEDIPLNLSRELLQESALIRYCQISELFGFRWIGRFGFG